MRKMEVFCMKRIWKCFLMTALLAAVSGCAAGGPQGRELTVFAAASMTETLEELKPVFEREHPGVTVVYNFDSSGTLKTQIQEGAVCDVFISAGQKQMDELEELDSVLEGSRVDLLENKVVLCVPDTERGSSVGSFDELAERLTAGDVLLCIGNSDVPAGQYAQKILAYYGLDENTLAEAGCITYGSNVKEVAAQVCEASVDAGVIYGTDAVSAGLVPVDSASPEMCGRVIYPAAVIRDSEQQKLAREYLNFLRGDAAMEVLEKVGFTPAES